MPDPSDRLYVMRRITMDGRTLEPERCATFASLVEAQIYIERSIAPFVERGSDGIRWWYKHNGNLEIHYWLESARALSLEMDGLLSNLMENHRLLIEGGDDGSMLAEMATGTRPRQS